jgi:hypothetical protein
MRHFCANCEGQSEQFLAAKNTKTKKHETNNTDEYYFHEIEMIQCCIQENMAGSDEGVSAIVVTAILSCGCVALVLLLLFH